MALSVGVTGIKISSQANALFGANGFDRAQLTAFLCDFSKAHFCHACAFPKKEKSTLVPHMAARLTSQKNGGRDIYMTMEDVDFALQALREPAHKYENERGQSVTLYPQLVEALIQAKANLKLYCATEMQAYLTQSFAARAQQQQRAAKMPPLNNNGGRSASHLSVVKP